MNKQLLILLISSFLISGTLTAQVVTTENGWNIRTDRPAESLNVGNNAEADIFLDEQSDGWRITTGPRAIYWRSDDSASGIYKVSAALRLFDTKGRDREGYGIFIGGNDLESDKVNYIYFLLRNTGEYLIKLRTADETSVIKDWTIHNGIRKFIPDEDMEFAGNELGVHVADGAIKFMINGSEVHSVGTQGLNPDGSYGIRINHAVDLMVEELKLAER